MGGHCSHPNGVFGEGFPRASRELVSPFHSVLGQPAHLICSCEYLLIIQPDLVSAIYRAFLGYSGLGCHVNIYIYKDGKTPHLSLLPINTESIPHVIPPTPSFRANYEQVGELLLEDATPSLKGFALPIPDLSCEPQCPQYHVSRISHEENTEPRGGRRWLAPGRWKSPAQTASRRGGQQGGRPSFFVSPRGRVTS